MLGKDVINLEKFDLLLDWLDRDREAAAQKYENIRRRLVRILTGRGCSEADELADETFDRVAAKLPQLADGYVGEPALYFYGVADKIYLEWLRRQKKIKNTELPETVYKDAEQSEIEFECLEKCLEKLPDDQHRLIVEYYREEKSAKIKQRQQLAGNLGISANALLVKVSRIRARLRVCVRKCCFEKI